MKWRNSDIDPETSGIVGVSPCEVLVALWDMGATTTPNLQKPIWLIPLG
jgi:hypothetical protein